MKIMKQNLVAIALGLGIGLSVTTAEAITPFVFDATRTAEFAVQGVQRMLSYVSEAQKVNSKEEEKKLWEKRKKNKEKDGDSSSSDGESGGSGESGGGGSDGKDDDCKSSKKLPYESQYYRYLGGKTDQDMKNENIDDEDEDNSGEEDNDGESDDRESVKSVNPTSMGSEKYLPAKSDTKSAEDYIREHFFYDPDLSKVTQAKKNEIIQHRYAYLETLAQEVLELSIGARSAIQSDLSVLSKSKTTAGGDINQVEFMIQTKKVMAEQKAADIILQAKLMELEAAKMFLNLSPQRIEDPDKEKNGSEEK